MIENYKKQEIEYEDQIAGDYNTWYHQTYLEKHFTADFANFVKKYVKKGDKVLDLGCGPASLWGDFSKISGIELTGVDISPKMIGEAKKLFPKGHFKVGDSENIPYKDQTFDCIICSSVLHHLPKTDKSFQEIKRVLKPEGVLLGREPQIDQFMLNSNIWILRIIAVFRLISVKKTKYSSHEEPPIHQYHHAYKIDEFAKKMNKYFSIENIESKYPFSSHFSKVTNIKLAKSILALDKFLPFYKGNQFLYRSFNHQTGKNNLNTGIYLEKLKTQSQKLPLKFLWKLLGLMIILIFSTDKK